MPTQHRLARLVLPVLVAICAATPVLANTAVLSAACGVTGTALTVDLMIDTSLPAAWAGWAVTRWTIGPCEESRLLLGPLAFPEGGGSWSFADPTARPGIAYKYVIWAVDAQGGYLDLTDEAIADRWTAETYTTCGGAAAMRGWLGGTDGGRTWTWMCAEGCWEFISYIDDLPPALAPLVGAETLVELVGALHMGPEGPYITDVTGWSLPAACDAVATTRETWGGVKARYR